MTIKELIHILKDKDQSLDVEYVVVDNQNNIQALSMQRSAHNLSKILKLFKEKTK